MLEILKVSVVIIVFLICTEEGMIFAWYYKMIQKLPDFLYKPAGGCNLCFAGQTSLWYYFIAHWHAYNFFTHLVFISATILIVLIIDKIINYE